MTFSLIAQKVVNSRSVRPTQHRHAKENRSPMVMKEGMKILRSYRVKDEILLNQTMLIEFVAMGRVER